MTAVLPDVRDLVAPAIAALPQRSKRLTRPKSISVKSLRGPLKPWMLAYARELALAPDRMSIAEKRVLISQLTRVSLERVGGRVPRALEQRADFQELIDQYEAAPAEAARLQFDHVVVPHATRVYRLALTEQERRLDAKRPIDPETNEPFPDVPAPASVADLRQVSVLVAPALQRVLPRTAAGGSVAAIQVTVQVGSQAGARLDEPAVTVTTAEVVDALPNDAT